MLKFISLAMLLTALATVHVQAQSFNCRYAKLSTEVAICKDTYLGDLDERMARIYSQLKNEIRGPDGRYLRSSQKQFLYSRNACGYDDSCIAQTYERRINLMCDMADGYGLSC